MTPRPPADAVVALRSLPRRYRAVFAGREDDESIEDLAHRNGPDGHSALDHVVAATRTLTFLGRALQQVLVEEDPLLHPAVLDAARREWPDAGGTVDERLSELGWEAEALADRVAHLGADEWLRHGRVADADETVSALSVLWDAVDSAVDHLRSAERALQHARG